VGATIDHGRFSFPHQIASLRVFEPLPDTGTIDVETRFGGFHDGNPDLPAVDLQLCRDERVLVDFRMVLILVPLGRLGQTPPDQVRAFSRDRAYIPALLLSTADNGVTMLRGDDVEAADSIPGTVSALYDLPPGEPETTWPTSRPRNTWHAARPHTPAASNSQTTSRQPGVPTGRTTSTTSTSPAARTPLEYATP
jgi:hypothetical protein